jgi:angiopoietin 2
MSMMKSSGVREAMRIVVLVAAILSCAVMGEDSGYSLCLRMQHRQMRDQGEMLENIKTLLSLQSQQSGQIRELVGRMDTMENMTKARMDTLEETTLDGMDTVENTNTRMDTMQYKLHALMEKVDDAMSHCDRRVIGIPVKCDSLGWMAIQRRVDNAFNFPTRNWTEYKNGFGDPNYSFWLGLEHIHRITNIGPTSLRVELTAFDGQTRFAEYSSFRVEGEEDGYRLRVSGYTGTAGDSLTYHDGRQFSTVDRDQDTSSTTHCAVKYEGAWWHKDCHKSHLNSVYRPTGQGPYGKSILWYQWLGYYYSYKSVAMKLRFV